MSIESAIEQKIKDAIAHGEFDNLTGSGKPLDLDAYFNTPEDLRMAFAMLRSNNFVPEEVEMLKEIASLKEQIKDAEGDPLVAEIARQERWDVIPGAESLDDFGSRLRGAIEEIVAMVPAGSVAVAFAHGAVIGHLCAMATDSRPFAFIHADNGSISRLVIHGDGRWLLRSFNETRHLDTPTGPVG